MGDLVQRRTVRLAPHYARLAALLFLMTVILGGGPDQAGALLFLMFGLILSQFPGATDGSHGRRRYIEWPGR